MKRTKYKTLGKICKQLSLNGFNDFSKKIVDDFSKSIISLGSKKYISQSIDYMYSEMLGLFIDEFTILNEKYPLHNIVGIGKVLNLTKNNIDDFFNIILRLILFRFSRRPICIHKKILI